uniref:Uncharacterized protein n=1 Tax=Romanomermis culicivorax TaxID=13658 RepID=A0A915IW65_ROMCU
MFKKKEIVELSWLRDTSGGTTVPLEENTVRFLDNFSAVDQSKIPKAIDYYREYQEVVAQNRLLSIEFVTLNDYLALLLLVSKHLERCGSYSMLYLAAAVSDFYIPQAELKKVCSNNDRNI